MSNLIQQQHFICASDNKEYLITQIFYRVRKVKNPARSRPRLLLLRQQFVGRAVRGAPPPAASLRRTCEVASTLKRCGVYDDSIWII